MDAAHKKIRLDKWLWAARFFKTRVLASEAVNGGKVHLEGQRVKPARSVKMGDCYQILRGYERFEIIVTGLSERRGSATCAQALYQETETSIEQRQLESERRRFAALQRPRTESRPDKKQRRKIRQFTGKS